MTASELIETIEEAGGRLELNGDKVRYAMPTSAAHLVDVLRLQREEVKAILRERHRHSQPPAGLLAALPDGVHVLAWEPREAPVVLTRCSIVTNVRQFVATTLKQLEHALAGDNPFLAGNWSVRELVERLEQAGLKVEIENGKNATG